ncbi:MAG: CoA transferase [Alphaproteobacteria bacterium]|nr:CoA transferase [Alphaproteobacteria bacterium]MCB9928586.1 CoA transferase [Alphaproteobacteria bacterium]
MADRLFEGLVVLDIASFIAAPVATTFLADFGANVIKIEAPGGDGYRALHAGNGMPDTGGQDFAWMCDNRSKRGLCLDLVSESGQDILRRLIAKADVLVTNFPMPVRRKLKLMYEDVAPLNDRLIYASLTAYGEEGPESERTGFDSTALYARTGMMDMMRAPGVAPVRSLPGMGDHPTGTALYGAIMTGLYRRERTGKGSHVSTSLVANGMWMNGFYAQAALMGAQVALRPHRDDAPNAVANHYCAKDGRWFILAVLNEAKQAPLLFEAMGRPDLLDDPRFADPQARRENSLVLTKVMDEIFARHDWAYWKEHFDRLGITYGQVAKMEDLAGDGQLRHAGAVVPADGGFGADWSVGTPVLVRDEAKRPPAPAPAIGQHNAEILAEFGYAPAEIAAFAAAGVLK